MAAATDSDHSRLMPLEAVATWLLPGLGHILIGQRCRGFILMFAISGLWLAGLLIGGVSCIDHREHTAWFAGQSLVAATLPVDLWHQSLSGRTVPIPDANPPYQPSLGRSNEQGILYTALAGLLNLLAMIDVGYCDPERRRAGGRDHQAPTPAA